MRDVFAPKITYRMAGKHIDLGHRKLTPWAYLQDWHMSDRDPNTTLKGVADRMKQQWPGNYRIVEQEDYPYRGQRQTKWVIEFDDPAEETMFMLRWA